MLYYNFARKELFLGNNTLSRKIKNLILQKPALNKCMYFRRKND